MEFLTTTDRDLVVILLQIAKRCTELAELQRKDLAAHIVNNYVRVRRRG